MGPEEETFAGGGADGRPGAPPHSPAWQEDAHIPDGAPWLPGDLRVLPASSLSKVSVFTLLPASNDPGIQPAGRPFGKARLADHSDLGCLQSPGADHFPCMCISPSPR